MRTGLFPGAAFTEGHELTARWRRTRQLSHPGAKPKVKAWAGLRALPDSGRSPATAARVCGRPLARSCVPLVSTAAWHLARPSLPVPLRCPFFL